MRQIRFPQNLRRIPAGSPPHLLGAGDVEVAQVALELRIGRLQVKQRLRSAARAARTARTGRERGRPTSGRRLAGAAAGTASDLFPALRVPSCTHGGGKAGRAHRDRTPSASPPGCPPLNTTLCSTDAAAPIRLAAALLLRRCLSTQRPAPFLSMVCAPPPLLCVACSFAKRLAARLPGAAALRCRGRHACAASSSAPPDAVAVWRAARRQPDCSAELQPAALLLGASCSATSSLAAQNTPPTCCPPARPPQPPLYLRHLLLQLIGLHTPLLHCSRAEAPGPAR